MTSITSARVFVPRPAIPILLLLALLLAALAAFVLFQAGGPSIPFGTAENGRIVFVDGSSLVSVAGDGSDRQIVAEVPGGANLPAVSPDGQSVAYVAGNDHLEIASIAHNAAASSLIRIEAPGMAAYGASAWSANGDQVAFVAADARSDHLFVANADGTNVHEVAAEMIAAKHFIGWAGFSPDGRWIAFVESPDPGQGRLVVAAPDGSRAKPLATGGIEMGDGAGVSWSPDPATQRILYLAVDGATRYYDLATDKVVDVAIGFWPSWSPTGDRVAYWRDGTKVVRTPTSPAESRTPTEVFASFAGACQDHAEMAGKAFCGPVTWSPDGTRLIATEVTGNGILSLRSDGSGDPIAIDLGQDRNPGEGGYVAWQPVPPSR